MLHNCFPFTPIMMKLHTKTPDDTKSRSLNPFNHTSGVKSAVTPTDCLESVCNRCVIEVFGGGFLCYRFAF